MFLLPPHPRRQKCGTCSMLGHITYMCKNKTSTKDRYCGTSYSVIEVQIIDNAMGVWSFGAPNLATPEIKLAAFTGQGVLRQQVVHILGAQVWQLPLIVLAEEEPYIFGKTGSANFNWTAKHNMWGVMLLEQTLREFEEVLLFIWKSHKFSWSWCQIVYYYWLPQHRSDKNSQTHWHLRLCMLAVSGEHIMCSAVQQTSI